MAAATLEAAIPEYLRMPRTCPARTPANYEPPFPAYCARFSPSVQGVVMAIIGAQHESARKAQEAGALDQILSFMKSNVSSSSGSMSDSDTGPESAALPKHYDLASVTDAAGFYNEVVIAYWDNANTYKVWESSSGFHSWWSALDAITGAHGWFKEVFLPSIDRLETAYSGFQPGMGPEGHGTMSTHVSGAVQEHVYWGSMRDRLPISQVDDLVGERATAAEESSDPRKARVTVPGKQNLCVIRSGQDWSKTNPEERKLYLDTMHPVLIEGMDFLRDKGEEVGCYSCRLMNVLGQSSSSPYLTSDTDRTFGLAYFDDIASLEKWSKEHKTHLNIFSGFLTYVKKLDFNVTLHLYHEVLVLKPEQQNFEYIGCHAGTGMLGGLEERS